MPNIKQASVWSQLNELHTELGLPIWMDGNVLGLTELQEKEFKALSPDSHVGKECFKAIADVRSIATNWDSHPELRLRLFQALLLQCKILYFG